MGKLVVRVGDGDRLDFVGCFADVDPEGWLSIRADGGQTSVAQFAEGKWSWWRYFAEDPPVATGDVMDRLRDRVAWLNDRRNVLEAEDLQTAIDALDICVQLVDALGFQEDEWVDNLNEKRDDLTDGDSRTFDLLQIARAKLGMPAPARPRDEG